MTISRGTPAALRARVAPAAQLLGPDRQVIERAPARPAKRAASRVAIDDAQRRLAGHEKEEDRKQDGRGANDDRSHAGTV